MKNIRLLFYVVYQYYSSAKSIKNKQRAYTATVYLFVAFLGLNLATLLRLFNLSSVAYFFGFGDYKRLEAIVRISLTILIPGYFLISIFIKENDLKNLRYDEGDIKKGKIIIISYMILTFIALGTIYYLKRQMN